MHTYVYIFSKLKKKLYGPFLRMGFNCLKATEPLQLVVQGGSSFSLILLCALFQLLTPQVQYLEPALHGQHV